VENWSLLGFRMGSSTAGWVFPHHTHARYRYILTCNFSVCYKTHGTFGTHGFFALTYCIYNLNITSVATVVTNAFQKNELWMPRKLAKTMRIFVKIDNIKNQRVTFWPERIRLVFLTLWSSHKFSRDFVTRLMLHSMGNIGPILLGQNMTPQFSMLSIFTNSLMVLANFLGIHNLIFSKSISHNHGNTT
jgi:hypothetical protein